MVAVFLKVMATQLLRIFLFCKFKQNAFFSAIVYTVCDKNNPPELQTQKPIGSHWFLVPANLNDQAVYSL